MQNPEFDVEPIQKSRTKLNAALVIGVGVICFSLLVFIIAVMNRYTDTVEDKISDKARLYAMGSDEAVSDFLSEYEGCALYAAGVLQDKKNMVNAFSPSLKALKENGAEMKTPKDVYYVKDGKLYDSNTNENTDPNLAALTRKAGEGKTGLFGTVTVKDATGVSMQWLAFYAPVPGDNPNADAVILFYDESILDNISVMSVTTVEASEFVILCSKSGSGRVMQVLYPAGDRYEGALSVEENGQIKNLFDKYVPDADAKSDLLTLLEGSDSGAVTFTMDSEQYAVSVSHNRVCDDYAVISLYRAGNLDNAETTAFASIGAMLVILCLSVPLVFLGLIGFVRQRNKQLRRFREYDEKLQCPTLAGMEEIIPKRIADFPGSRFAVVGGRLKHYQYLKANYPDVAENMLRQIRRLLEMSLSIGEVVGLGNESEFVLLLHYRDTQSLTSRLYNLSNYITENIGNNQYNVHLDFGAYEVEKGTKDSARQMIENAFSVIESDAANAAVTSVSVYNVVFRENYMKNAEVEVKMDYALQHDEFKVFFQPKINSETGAIDGCEALVRWLDPETGEYRAPGTFMPLFEQNGFVIKLDRYVFYKVCEFIGSRVSEHLPIFPTSVNVSRLSAVNAEFLDYYASVKKQFNVPDDFLTLELTESIAASSYETLNRMSVAFHKNRFLLSIDDFGSGYSSMNVLKNVNVDEIKMDRMFLDAGVSEQRDRTIMASIVRLADDLGIKVVQEGVETEEQLKIVQEAGCKIIQGFYFSKPLSIPEYIRFVNVKMDEEDRKARQRTFKNMEEDDLPSDGTNAENPQ